MVSSLAVIGKIPLCSDCNSCECSDDTDVGKTSLFYCKSLGRKACFYR